MNEFERFNNWLNFVYIDKLEVAKAIKTAKQKQPAYEHILKYIEDIREYFNDPVMDSNIKFYIETGKFR